MLIDFLNSMSPVLEAEAQDYESIIDILKIEKTANFMPSVTFDMWPVYILGCSAEAKYIQGGAGDVYIVSIGEADYFFRTELERIVRDFYDDRECEYSDMYGGEIAEMILLSDKNTADISENEDISGRVKCVYMRLDMPDYPDAHMFFVADNTLGGWENIFEQYDVQCKVLIDSHKGMGDWLINTQLWRRLNCTERRELLPEYYFKGKYISTQAPGGFEFICAVEESAEHQCISKLYKTNMR